MRVRPGRSSRPRTRIRPSHDEATDGFVIAVDRGRYTCAVAGREVTAMRARELGRRGVVVGDRVGIVGDVTGGQDSLARIVRIEERACVLRRTADDDDTTVEGRQERVVVANAQQLVIVCALADPPPRTGFVDRCLVAAYDADIEPLLCLTKADLAGPEQLLAYYAELDLPYVLCQPDRPLAELEHALRQRISVLIGHSGVGKSTLVNRLRGYDGFTATGGQGGPAGQVGAGRGAERVVGAVTAGGRGRHTSTSVVALALPEGGWIIDTPGIRSFGIAHVDPDNVLHGFPELVDASAHCPPNCDHVGTATGCGLDALVADGRADPRRLASYRRLLASRTGDAGDAATATGRGTSRTSARSGGRTRTGGSGRRDPGWPGSRDPDGPVERDPGGPAGAAGLDR